MTLKTLVWRHSHPPQFTRIRVEWKLVNLSSNPPYACRLNW